MEQSAKNLGMLALLRSSNKRSTECLIHRTPTRAVASGGGGAGEAAAPPDQLSQRNQVFVVGFSLFKEFVFFRLSCFNCSDLQLFAIFIAGKSVGPRCVQMVSKTKQNSLMRLACTICTVHSRLIYKECLELA